jgi:hypothetical protein
MGDILRTMRKEVGLSHFNSIRSNEALAFFVNDMVMSRIMRKIVCRLWQNKISQQ